MKNSSNTKRRNPNHRVQHQPARNKKLQQLDVRMRSKAETRLRRVAVVRWVFKSVLVAASVIALGICARWIYEKTFYENVEFSLTDLQVESNGGLDYQRIVGEAGITEGMNLLSIDIEDVRARLGNLAQVESVEVTRQLPNQLKIRIFERFPMAWLECPALGIRSQTSHRGFLLDIDGAVLPCEALLRRYLALPVVRVRSLARVKPGARIESEQVIRALDLIGRSNEIFFEEQLEIVEVELRNEYSMKATYNSDAEVTFGMQDIGAQLQDLKLIMAHTLAQNRQMATLNLMARKNIPITYFNFPADGVESLRQEAQPVYRQPASTDPGSGEAERHLDAIRSILSRG